MIRVLEVLATLKRAGAERMAVSLARGLDRARFEPALVSLYDPFPDGLESELDNSDIRVWHLGKRPGFDVRMYARLGRVVRDFRPDIIHTHSYVMRYTHLLPARARVHTVHNLAAREVDTAGRWIHRVAYKSGTLAVAVGQEVARSFRQLYKREPDAVIPNGIDLARFDPDRGGANWRAAHNFKTDDVLIVSVARLDLQKNPVFLADVVELLGCAHLVLVGQGSLASRLSGRPHVHLLGARADIPQILRGCDLFALASDWEGYPLAVLEAMAAGLPVVATNVGGLPEIVQHECTGLLVAPGDAAGFAAALGRLVENAAVRATMGTAARQRARCFGVDRMIEGYSELFERAVR